MEHTASILRHQQNNKSVDSVGRQYNARTKFV